MSNLPNNLEKLTKKELIDIIQQLTEKVDTPESFFKQCFEDDIKNRVGNPFPVTRPLGMMRAVRSIIPKEHTERVVFHLDQSTNERVIASSLKYKITGDEFIRQLLWTYFAIYR